LTLSELESAFDDKAITQKGVALPENDAEVLDVSTAGITSTTLINVEEKKSIYEDFVDIGGESISVEMGDEVALYYDDEPDRELNVIISEDGDDHREGVIRKGSPLAKALLGCLPDDSVEVNIGGKFRVAVIKSIIKTPAPN